LVADDLGPVGADAGRRLPIVLLIEDDSPIAQMICLVLEDAGFRVIWRADGTTGLSAATSVDPCAIVLDLKLPDVPGQQVLVALKGDAKTKDIPIVIASATAFELTPEEKQLAEAVLGKPFEIEDLIAVIARASVGHSQDAGRVL
jgi:two-component system, OmpR family, response regulator RpaA